LEQCQPKAFSSLGRHIDTQKGEPHHTDGRTDGLQTWWDMIVVTASTPHQMLGSLGSKSWVELLGGKEQFCCANVWHFVQFFNVLSANLKKFNTQTSSVKNGCLCFISLNKARSATYTSLGMFT
jgi:hypothetical protein